MVEEKVLTPTWQRCARGHWTQVWSESSTQRGERLASPSSSAGISSCVWATESFVDTTVCSIVLEGNRAVQQKVPREGLLHCCTVQPRRSRWSARRRRTSRPSRPEGASRITSGTGCLCQQRTVWSEPPEPSLPGRAGSIPFISQAASIQCKRNSVSSYLNPKKKKEKKRQLLEAHISASHLRNERAGYDDGGAQHDDEMLEP